MTFAASGRDNVQSFPQNKYEEWSLHCISQRLFNSSSFEYVTTLNPGNVAKKSNWMCSVWSEPNRVGLEKDATVHFSVIFYCHKLEQLKLAHGSSSAETLST